MRLRLPPCKNAYILSPWALSIAWLMLAMNLVRFRVCPWAIKVDRKSPNTPFSVTFLTLATMYQMVGEKKARLYPREAGSSRAKREVFNRDEIRRDCAIFFVGSQSNSLGHILIVKWCLWKMTI